MTPERAPDLLYKRCGQRWDQWTPPIQPSPFHRMVGGEFVEPELVAEVIQFCGIYLNNNDGSPLPQHHLEGFGWARGWTPPYIVSEESP